MPLILTEGCQLWIKSVAILVLKTQLSFLRHMHFGF